MAEEDKDKQTEETPEADAPEEKPEAEVSEEPEPEAATDEGGGAPEAATPEAADEALEGLDWKARRRLERSRRSGEAGPQRAPADRAAERGERRAQARKGRSSYRRKRREKAADGGAGTAPAERHSVARKMRQGKVVSNRADKTITVQIDVARRHPTYEKIIRTSNTLHAHDERNEANQGDLVRIVETRPISRSKRWRLVEILEKAK